MFCFSSQISSGFPGKFTMFTLCHTVHQFLDQPWKSSLKWFTKGQKWGPQIPKVVRLTPVALKQLFNCCGQYRRPKSKGKVERSTTKSDSVVWLRRWFDSWIFCNGNELVSDELWVHGHPYVSIQLDDGCFNTATQAPSAGPGRQISRRKWPRS